MINSFISILRSFKKNVSLKLKHIETENAVFRIILFFPILPPVIIEELIIIMKKKKPFNIEIKMLRT